MKGIKCKVTQGKQNEMEVYLEEIPIEIYKKICKIARRIGQADPTFKSTTEYFGKNPLRTTNLTYYVQDGCPDFCGQINKQIPNGVSIHFHDYFYEPLLRELEDIGIQIEEGKDCFHQEVIEMNREG